MVLSQIEISMPIKVKFLQPVEIFTATCKQKTMPRRLIRRGMIYHRTPEVDRST
jgi:hypothetical protein